MPPSMEYIVRQMKGRTEAFTVKFYDHIGNYSQNYRMKWWPLALM